MMAHEKNPMNPWSLFLFLTILLAPALLGAASIEESSSPHEQVREALLHWKGGDLRPLIRRIKTIDPSRGVIESLRAMENAYSTSPEIGTIRKRLSAYQRNVRENVISIRKSYLKRYVQAHPRKARTLYGFGDIGSWTHAREIKVSSDFDWSMFGVDKSVVRELVDGYNAELARSVGLDPHTDLAKELDVVVTPEGFENESGVYANKASKEWASRNFDNFTLVTPEGAFVSYRGDAVAERAQARQMARIRSIMSEPRYGDAYDLLFDSKGRLRLDNLDRLSPKARERFESLRGELEMFKAQTRTMSGGIIEMAAHLRHEVLDRSEKMNTEALIGKIYKYAQRADNLKNLGRLPESVIEKDILLGKNGKYRKAYEFIASNRGKNRNVVEKEYGKRLDKTAAQRLGNQVESVLERLAVLQFQFHVESALLAENTTERSRAIEEIGRSFEADLPRELYPGLHEEISATLKTVRELERHPKELDAVRKAIAEQKHFRELQRNESGLINRFNRFLGHTKTGRKIRAMESKATLHIGEQYGLKPHETPTLEWIRKATESTRVEEIPKKIGSGAKITHYLGMLTLFTGGIEAIRNTHSDTEMAMALGKVWATSTLYGLIASEGYASVTEGDFSKMYHVLVMLLIPEASIPDLMRALGGFAGGLVTKTYLDDQLEAMFIVSNYYDELHAADTSASDACEGTLLIDGTEIGVFSRSLFKEIQYGSKTIASINNLAMEKTGGGRQIAYLKADIVRHALQNLRSKGEVTLFPSGPSLSRTAAMIRNINEEIDTIAKKHGGEIPSTATDTWLNGPIARGMDFSPGVRRSIEKLLIAREKEWEKIPAALAEALTTSFRERCRAEKELKQGREHIALAHRREKVAALLEKLSVKNSCMKTIEEKSTDNVVNRTVGSEHEKALREMKVLQRYQKVYNSILLIRELLQRRYAEAVGREPVPVPLNGWPQLICEPAVDLNNAKKLLSDTLQKISRVHKVLTQKKAAQLKLDAPTLDRECEKKALRLMIANGYRQSYHRINRKNYGWIKHHKTATYEIFDRYDLDQLAEKAYKLQDLAYRRYQEALDEYTALCLSREKNPRRQEKTERGEEGPEEKLPKKKTPATDTVQKPREAGDETKATPAKKRENPMQRRMENGGERTAASKTPKRMATKEKQENAPASPQKNDTAKGPHAPQSKGSKRNEKKETGQIKALDKEAKSALEANDCKQLHDLLSQTLRFDPESIQASERKNELVFRLKEYIRTVSSSEGTWFKKHVGGYIRQIQNTILEPYNTILTNNAFGYGTPFDEETCKAKVMKAYQPYKDAEKEFAKVSASIFEDSDQAIPYRVCQKVDAFLEKYKIPRSLKIPERYKNLCASGKEKKPTADQLSLSLNGPASIRAGDIATIEAHPVGGKGKVTIEWTGENLSPNGHKALFTATRSGNYTIRAVATDSLGKQAFAVLEIQVSGKEKRFSLIAPTAPLYYGKSYPFSIDMEKEGSGKAPYEFLWQPSGKELAFDPPSGHLPRVKITLKTLGKIRIWAEILQNGEKIGETHSVTIEVLPPKLTMKISPKQPSIGTLCRAEITVKPEIDDKFLSFRWLPMGEEVQEIGERNGGRSYLFKLKTLHEVNVNALVWASDPEEEIAKLKASIKAHPYKISISHPKRAGPAPWRWDPKKGKAVELPTAISTFQNAEVHCSISPTPPKKIRYHWSVSPDGCTVSAPYSASTYLNAHKTGTYTIRVTVSDRNGVLLGKGSTNYRVTVSQRDEEARKRKALKTKKAMALKKAARKLWENGKLEEALSRMERARKLHPGDPDILREQERMRRDKERLDRLLRTTRRLLEKHALAEAKKPLKEAAGISSRYPPYIRERERLRKEEKAAEAQQARKRQIASLIENARRFWKEGKLEEALETLERGEKRFPGNDTLQRELREKRKRKKEEDLHLVQAEQAIRGERFPHARTLLGLASRINSRYGRYLETLAMLEEAEKRKGEEREIGRILQNADTSERAGDLDDAVATLENGEKRFPHERRIRDRLESLRKRRTALEKQNAWAEKMQTILGKRGNAQATGEKETTTKRKEWAKKMERILQHGQRRKNTKQRSSETPLPQSSAQNEWSDRMKRILGENGKGGLRHSPAQESAPSGKAAPRHDSRRKHPSEARHSTAHHSSPSLQSIHTCPKRMVEALTPYFSYSDSEKGKDYYFITDRLGKKLLGCHYYHSGELANQTPFHNGVPHGTQTVYYRSGRVYLLQPWRHGKRDGKVRYYDKSGRLYGCSYYSRGQYIRSCMPNATQSPPKAASTLPRQKTETPPPSSRPEGGWLTYGNVHENKMYLHRSGNRVHGTYSEDNGRIFGEMQGNVFLGYWMENDSNEKCKTPLNGGYHWGRVRLVFKNDRFEGAWGYCDKTPDHSWTGQRLKK